jgi:hypothetical protein
VLAQLAPEFVDEICAVWTDIDLVGRLIEDVLGGERKVSLTTEAIIQLVRLYEFLEDSRTAGGAWPGSIVAP